VTGRSNCATGVHYTNAVGIRDTQVVILAVSMEYDAYDDLDSNSRVGEASGMRCTAPAFLSGSSYIKGWIEFGSGDEGRHLCGLA
jgi:hypothetical protein